MVEYVGNAIPAPGYSRGTVTVNQEVLYSMAGYTQKGVTLKAGQGVLKTGTVLAQDTATKKFVRFVSGGTGGAGTARGVLRKSVDTGGSADAPEFLGNILIKGILKYPVVSAANAGADLSAAVTGLNGRADTVLGTFSF